MDIVKFDKEKNIIEFNIGSQIIKINCNKLEWNNIIEKFDTILQNKIKVSEEDKLKIEFEKLKNIIKHLNIKNPNEYYSIASQQKLCKEPNITYISLWINWYSFLNIDTSHFIQDKTNWKTFCNKHNIKSFSTYIKKLKKYKQLPNDPCDFYGFKNIEYELGDNEELY